jgi:WD40 repeat protein
LGGVNGVAFSPGGKLLASADSDGTVRLWDPRTGQPVGAPIQASGRLSSVNGVAFSPDGKLLATAGSDGTARLWQVSLFARPYAALCTDVGPPTSQQWRQIAGGEPRPEVCA